MRVGDEFQAKVPEVLEGINTFLHIIYIIYVLQYV